MATGRRGRLGFYLWSLVACPLFGSAVALFVKRGEGNAATFVFWFLGLPALLSMSAARPTGRRTIEAVGGALGAAALGGATWFVTVLWLASHGAFD